jgi:hypothetical protein
MTVAPCVSVIADLGSEGEAVFSHGICLDCVGKHYQDWLEDEPEKHPE